MCPHASNDNPHAPPLRGSLPPKGANLPWGGPAANLRLARVALLLGNGPLQLAHGGLHRGLARRGQHFPHVPQARQPSNPGRLRGGY
ncbi:hypothetical protein C5F53_03120 [Rhodoferax sp. TS-BS-61-7]|nr:hypothetical protein C5F53_03120 [Rhodoferax sp. TS-BS-61-7]